MPRVVIIGAGGVGRVVVRKCASLESVFTELLVASRTKSKCDTLAAESGRPVRTAALDADDPGRVAALIGEFGADLVINVALPYQDLSIMEACLKTGAHYLDTANYEPPDEAKFSYTWQWAYHERFERVTFMRPPKVSIPRESGVTSSSTTFRVLPERMPPWITAPGLMALLGCGFDPGVTSVFCAHARKHHFDEIHAIDIIDCNAGDHGYAFATNFNPEINIREVSAKGRYWEKGAWIETEPMERSRTIEFSDGIGPKKAYGLPWRESLTGRRCL